jgi:hypothetical protein
MRTDNGGQPGDGQGRVRVSVPLPLFEKDSPPSRKTSRLRGRFCAQAQGKAKSRSKIKDGMIRTLRIPLPYYCCPEEFPSEPREVPQTVSILSTPLWSMHDASTGISVSDSALTFGIRVHSHSMRAVVMTLCLLHLLATLVDCRESLIQALELHRVRYNCAVRSIGEFGVLGISDHAKYLPSARMVIEVHQHGLGPRRLVRPDRASNRRVAVCRP